MRTSKVWESKRCTSGCCCRCQCVADVLQLIAHHAGRSKHTDLCVFLLNWLSLKGSAPQLNVTTGLCFLSVSLLSMTGPHLLTLPCRLTNIPPGGRRHISWYKYSLVRSILHDMKKRAEINVPATRNSWCCEYRVIVSVYEYLARWLCCISNKTNQGRHYYWKNNVNFKKTAIRPCGVVI